jgi:hypothetical protein
MQFAAKHAPDYAPPWRRFVLPQNDLADNWKLTNFPQNSALDAEIRGYPDLNRGPPTPNVDVETLSSCLLLIRLSQFATIGWA